MGPRRRAVPDAALSAEAREPRTATLLIMCPDRPGLVAAISGFIYRHGGNILAADQHSDVESGRFYMRVVWDLGGFALDRAGTAAALDALGRDYAMEWDLRYSETQQRVAVLVSKTPHCLYDLLQARQLGELGGASAGVISNHDDLPSVASPVVFPDVSVPVTNGVAGRP